MEGLEPSSKRGTNELSTCLVSSWFSSTGRVETPNPALSSLNFGGLAEHLASYPRFNCTAISISLGKMTIGRCLVYATAAQIKRDLLYFNQAARA